MVASDFMSILQFLKCLFLYSIPLFRLPKEFSKFFLENQAAKDSWYLLDLICQKCLPAYGQLLQYK